MQQELIDLGRLTSTRHIIPISGKDSLATALLQQAHEPNLPYEFVFNDVGAELPEVYSWLDKIESKTGWTIQRVGQNLEAIIDGYNGFLPSAERRYCTKYAKIKPFEKLVKGDRPIIVYYGLRADEPRIGYVPLASSNIEPRYPLRNFNIDLQGVYSILEAQDLLPPDFHWQRLEDAVVETIAPFVPGDWRSHFKPWQLRTMFAWRTRGNCYFCFYQQVSEFLGLREHHPDLFERAKEFEQVRTKEFVPSIPGMEAIATEKQYSFIKGYPLSSLDNPAERDRVFKKKVWKISNQIIQKFNTGLFDLEIDSEIALTSCGLLCGK